MTRLARLIRRWTEDRGSVIVLAAVGMTMAIGLLGLVVDGGVVHQERRRLQNAADAAALAGVQRLPGNPSAAVSDAVAWASKNGAGSASAAVSTTNAANDTITVTITNERALSISSFFGKGSASVTATARAVVSSKTGGAGILPWGLVPAGNPCYSGGQPVFGTSCTLKYGAPGDANGNFGPLALGGNGASTYRSNIVNGSSGTYRIGDRVPTQTGNMVGPTSQAIGDRLSRTGCGGDTFSEVFSLGPDGVYSIICPNSPRIILVPVVDGLPNPGNATIVDFALLYLESYRFNGGHSEVTGKLVRVNITDPEQYIGGYRNNGLRVLRLVQ